MKKIDHEIINTRIRTLIKYLNRLKGFESVNLENYLNEFDLQLISERLLQLIVEVGTDLNIYLLVQLHQDTPTTYFDSFIKAGQQGIITRDLAAQSAGMRNRLVHQYEDIDNRVVFAAIPNALQQYPLYIHQIITYLDSLEEENG